MGEPSSTSQPKPSRFGTHYSKTFSAWIRVVQQHTHALPKVLGAAALTVDILVSKPKSTKLSVPKGAISGYVTGVVEGLHASGVLTDKSLVTTLSATKRWCVAGEEPGAVLRVAHL